MQIKAADDRQQDIEALTRLCERPDVDGALRQRIQTELRKLQAGLKGEREAAYEIEFHWGRSHNWLSIHDLRIEHEGRVAQIDHLLMNRLLELYVLESKHFGEGLAINECGEFTGFFRGRAYGVPSPLEQNRRHLEVLKSVLTSGRIELPRRLGMTLKPTLMSLVLVSKGARISRPKHGVAGVETIIKNDQLLSTIQRQEDDVSLATAVASVSKVIGADTLETFARSLAALHQPLQTEWEARFGLSTTAPAAQRVTARRAEPEPEVTRSPARSQAPAGRGAGDAGSEEATRKPRACRQCGAPVSYAVARFCWFNKSRFGGDIYCMDCQASVPSSGGGARPPGGRSGTHGASRP